MAEVIQHGDTNPLIKVTSDEVAEWLRGKADELGFSDRSGLAVQVALRGLGDDEEDIILGGVPELVLMVSNIPGSRKPPSR